MAVHRSDLLDYQTYSERRESIRQQIFETKKPRRIHVGEYLTFLFENHDTIRYQVQEMMRAERIVKEEAIQHELDTYNALLGGQGGLGCALLIEIAEADDRKDLLTEWMGLEKHLYVKFEDGARAYAEYDAGQVGEDRLSAVQYLRFSTDGRVPVALGTDFPSLTAETQLTTEQRAALREDLAEAGNSAQA